MRIIICGLMFFFLTACEKSEQPQGAQNQATSTPTVANSPPTVAPTKVEQKHFYEGKEGTTYFYSKGISDNDRQSGTVANELLEVEYIGEKDNEYEFLLKNGEAGNVISCKAPCEFYTETVVVGSEVVRTTRYKNAPGSIAWGVISDAISGELEPAKIKINGKLKSVWFSAERGRLIPLDDTQEAPQKQENQMPDSDG